MKTYYEAELKRLRPRTDDFCTVKLSDNDGTSTKTLNINAASIPVLIAFLNRELERLKDHE